MEEQLKTSGDRFVARWGGVIWCAALAVGCAADALPEPADVVAGRSVAAASSEPTTVAQRPRLGAIVALSGPLQPAGEAIVAGLRAGLGAGIEPGGEPFELVVHDDGYEPAHTGSLVAALGADPGVLGLVGCLGTPTAIAGLPVAAEHGLCWCGGFSGAEILRRAAERGEAANFRASYQDEVRAMVRGLLGDAGFAADEVGFFTQRDGFGDDGFRAGLEELQALAGIRPGDVVHGRYDRELGVVSEGLAQLLGEPSPRRAVIVIGHGRAMSDLVRLAAREGYRPLWCGVSFVDSQAVAEDLGALADGLVFTAVVETLREASDPCTRFQVAVGARWRGSPLAFEVFLVGDALRRDAERYGIPRSRAEFTARTQALAEEVRGAGWGGLGSVLATVVREGDVVPLRWHELRGLAR